MSVPLKGNIEKAFRSFEHEHINPYLKKHDWKLQIRLCAMTARTRRDLMKRVYYKQIDRHYAHLKKDYPVSYIWACISINNCQSSLWQKISKHISTIANINPYHIIENTPKWLYWLLLCVENQEINIWGRKKIKNKYFIRKNKSCCVIISHIK